MLDFTDMFVSSTAGGNSSVSGMPMSRIGSKRLQDNTMKSESTKMQFPGSEDNKMAMNVDENVEANNALLGHSQFDNYDFNLEVRSLLLNWCLHLMMAACLPSQ
jgi:hypothetical protein